MFQNVWSDFNLCNQNTAFLLDSIKATLRTDYSEIFIDIFQCIKKDIYKHDFPTKVFF